MQLSIVFYYYKSVQPKLLLTLKLSKIISYQISVKFMEVKLPNIMRKSLFSMQNLNIQLMTKDMTSN